MNLYTALGWIATVAVPISPVFFFGWEVYKQVLTRSSSWLLAGGVGLVSAIGLEIVGILAGHLAMEFWRAGRMSRAYLAGGIMVIYVLIGVVELWGTKGKASRSGFLARFQETRGNRRKQKGNNGAVLETGHETN